MGAFLYFVPRVGLELDLPAIRKLGLGYAFECQPTVRQLGDGPDHCHGVILTASDRDEPTYAPTQQEWQAESGGRWWIGWDAHDPPGPEKLVRCRVLDGPYLTLGDGNPWIVPVARGRREVDGQLRWTDKLPKVRALNQGRWVECGTIARYQALWEMAKRWFEERHEALSESSAAAAVQRLTTWPDLYPAASHVLGANYRVGPEECSILRLLTDETVFEVLDATIEYSVWEEWLSKKAEAALRSASAGSSTSGGPAGSTGDTAQPS